MGRTFQVKTSMNGILRTEQIPHYDKSHLIQMNKIHDHEEFPTQKNRGFMPIVLPSSGSDQLISHNEDHKIWLLECAQMSEHECSKLAASLRAPAITSANWCL